MCPPTHGRNTVKLICASCLLSPALLNGGLPQETSDMVICTTPLAGYAPATGDAGASILRCDYCNCKVQLERHHLAWYGY